MTPESLIVLFVVVTRTMGRSKMSFDTNSNSVIAAAIFVMRCDVVLPALPLLGERCMTAWLMNVLMTSYVIYASELALSLVDCLMNINEVVFASKIPGKRYFASNFSTWPGILLLLVVSTRQKHQYQGEKCARHGINQYISQDLKQL